MRPVYPQRWRQPNKEKLSMSPLSRGSIVQPAIPPLYLNHTCSPSVNKGLRLIWIGRGYFLQLHTNESHRRLISKQDVPSFGIALHHPQHVLAKHRSVDKGIHALAAFSNFKQRFQPLNRQVIDIYRRRFYGLITGNQCQF